MKLFNMLVSALDAKEKLEEERKGVGSIRREIAECDLEAAVDEFEDCVREIVREELSKLKGLKE